MLALATMHWRRATAGETPRVMGNIFHTCWKREERKGGLRIDLSCNIKKLRTLTLGAMLESLEKRAMIKVLLYFNMLERFRIDVSCRYWGRYKGRGGDWP